MPLVSARGKQCDKYTQTDNIKFKSSTSYIINQFPFPRPEIRLNRNCYSNIKEAIAAVSYRTAVSVQKARVAVQTVCNKLYKHNYQLSTEEQQQFESNLLPTIIEESELEDEENSASCSNKPVAIKPRTKEQWHTKYQYVLPSPSVVSDYKHDMALHQEIIAATTLANLDDGTRVTLHFDTTGRSRVMGEWPALILNFMNDDKSKCSMIPLRVYYLPMKLEKTLQN